MCNRRQVVHTRGVLAAGVDLAVEKIVCPFPQARKVCCADRVRQRDDDPKTVFGYRMIGRDALVTVRRINAGLRAQFAQLRVGLVNRHPAVNIQHQQRDRLDVLFLAARRLECRRRPERPVLFARIAGFDRRLIICGQGSETSRGVVSIFPVNAE
jgi:hypothetical protein